MVVMILGNPDKFAILINAIKEWNEDETFYNGVLLFWVDGTLFPRELVTATLNCEIMPLKARLMNLTIDERLFRLPKGDAFKEIYNITFPEDFNINNNYCFDITPESFSDNHCYVFAVCNDEQVRIMAAELKYMIEDSRHDLKNISVSETFISNYELKEIVSKLDVY